MLSCNRESVERREVRSFTSRCPHELGADATNESSLHDLRCGSIPVRKEIAVWTASA